MHLKKALTLYCLNLQSDLFVWTVWRLYYAEKVCSTAFTHHLKLTLDYQGCIFNVQREIQWNLCKNIPLVIPKVCHVVKSVKQWYCKANVWMLKILHEYSMCIRFLCEKSILYFYELLSTLILGRYFSRSFETPPTIPFRVQSFGKSFNLM